MDVISKEGRLLLIAYSDLCPLDFDSKRYVSQAMALLEDLGKELAAYAEVETPGMTNHPYTVLADLGQNPTT